MVNYTNKWTLKVDSLLYHNLLDCDPNPQTNSLHYIWQIATYIVGGASCPAVASTGRIKQP